MMNRIGNFILSIHDVDVKNNECVHAVEVIKLNTDGTYTKKNLYYNGAISKLKNMSDSLLVEMLEKLIAKEENSVFSFEMKLSVDIT